MYDISPLPQSPRSQPGLLLSVLRLQLDGEILVRDASRDPEFPPESFPVTRELVFLKAPLERLLRVLAPVH